MASLCQTITMTKLDSVLKSRDTTLLTKFHLVKAMVFPVVMYGCESWTIKKAEHGRTDAFKLWYWRRLLRAPWTARSNQSILKEMNPECSLEGLMLKLNTLATWCKQPTDSKRCWCWERLSARGEGGNIRWDGWLVSLTQWTWVWANSRREWRTGNPDLLQFMGSQRFGHNSMTEQQQQPPPPLTDSTDSKTTNNSYGNYHNENNIFSILSRKYIMLIF